MEVIQYGNLCLDKETKMLVILHLPIRHHNKSYDYENNNKIKQKPKFLEEKCNKMSKPFKPSIFLWIFYQWSIERLF